MCWPLKLKELDTIPASSRQGSQSVHISKACLTCYEQNSLVKTSIGQFRVMFYRSQAGIRAWPAKSNTSVWGDVGSPSAEMQCRETKHKSINVAKVLKTEVKGSINISWYDLWRTKKGVRDFKKTGEVTWKKQEQSMETLEMDLGVGCLKLFGFQGPRNREAGNIPGNIKGLGASEVCLSAKVLSLSPQLL